MDVKVFEVARVILIAAEWQRDASGDWLAVDFSGVEFRGFDRFDRSDSKGAFGLGNNVFHDDGSFGGYYQGEHGLGLAG